MFGLYQSLFMPWGWAHWYLNKTFITTVESGLVAGQERCLPHPGLWPQVSGKGGEVGAKHKPVLFPQGPPSRAPTPLRSGAPGLGN